jgi:hypothetical protein
LDDARRGVLVPRRAWLEQRIEECAPGRAGGLQSHPTRFESLHSCLCRRGRTVRHRFCKPDHAGASPVVGPDQPAIRGRSVPSRWCNGSHKTLLSDQRFASVPGSWFDSRSGYSRHGPWVCWTACQLPKLLGPTFGRCPVRLLDGLLATRPASVLDSTADFESARRGSIPRRAAELQHVLGVCRIARDSAKVEDQVRFLARILKSLTLEPDGTATGCGHRRAALVRSKWVRFPPASFTGRGRLRSRGVPRFDKQGRWRCTAGGALGTASADRLGVFRARVLNVQGQFLLAQLAEHQTENLAVAGSIPVQISTMSASNRQWWRESATPEARGRRAFV